MSEKMLKLFGVKKRIFLVTLFSVLLLLALATISKALITPLTIIKPSPTKTVTTGSPVVSAYVNGGAEVTMAEMTIDNNPVVTNITKSLGRVSYTPTSPLIDGIHNVSLTVTDLNGATASLSWSFSVDTNIGASFPDMPVVNNATCWKCHPTLLAVNEKPGGNVAILGGKHTANTSCQACHNSLLANSKRFQECTYCHYDNYPAGSLQYMSNRHTTTYENIVNVRHSINDIHLSTTNNGCEKCHSRILSKEHFRTDRVRKDSNGNPINCDTCHTANYLGDEITTNRALRIEKTIAYQVQYSSVWNAPAGRTISRIYIDQALDASNFMEVYALYNGSWGLVYGQVTGTSAKWVDLPAATTALRTKLHSPSAMSATSWGIDVPKVTLTPIDTSPNFAKYNRIQTAITNQDTRCEACHSAGHKHTVQTYETVTNVSCSNCHATDKTSNYTELSDLHTNKGYTCDTCHNNPAIVGTIINNDGIVVIPTCSTCHNDTIATSAALKHASHDSATDFGAYTFENGVNCSSCHTTLAISDVHSTTACDSCHSSSVTAVKGVIENNSSSTPLKSPYTCADCHNSLTNKHNKNHDVTSYTTDTADNSCLDCHSKDVATVHQSATLNCNTCHGSNAPQATKDVIAANLSTNAARTGYKCTDCHTGLTNHNHAVSTFEAAPQVACQNCHNTDPATKSTDLVKLHKDKGYSCNTCHNSTFEGSVIIKDNNLVLPVCSTCHDGTKAKSADSKHTLHNSANGYGNYTYDSAADCSSCHANLALMDNHSATQCNNCHNSINTEVNKVILGNWSRTVPKLGYTCADCHNTLSNKHTPEHTAQSTETVNCSGCHTFNNNTAINVSTLHKDCNSCHSATANQVTKDFVLARKGTVSDVYKCEDCHGVQNGAKSHNKLHDVKSYTANTEDNSCLQCHAKDVSVVHKSTTLNCDTCHGNNSNQTTKDVIAANLSSNANRAGFKCTDCHVGLTNHNHNVNTFESTTQVNCRNCHSTDPTSGSTELSALHKNKGSCNLCHNSNFEGSVIINDNNLVLPVCSSCHDGTKATSADTKHATHDSATGFGAYTFESGVNCSSCHSSLAITTVHSNTTCDTCHSSSLSTVKGVIESNWSRAPIKTPYTCANCHNSLTNKHNKQHTVNNYTTDTTENSCLECHAKDVTSVHNSATLNCDTCHGANAPQKTKDVISANLSTVANRLGYNCVSCHTYVDHQHPVSSYETNAPVDCINCHATDKTAKTTELSKLHTNNCNLCHNATFEGTVIIKDGSMNVPTCNTCHDGTKAKLKETVHAQHDSAKGYGSQAKLDGTVNSNCSVCHKSLVLNDNHTKINCNSCHTSTNTNIQQVIQNNLHTLVTKAGYNCDSCHGIVHNGWDTLHNSSFVTNPQVNCSTCHTSPLHTEHSKWKTAAGQPILCSTCHDSTNATYKNAIASKKTNCDACHTTYHADLNTPHTSTYADVKQWDCSKCHSNVLQNEHTKWKTSTGQPITCNTCHNSTSTNVKTAITNKNTKCNACHTVHTEITTPHLKTYFPDLTVDCLNCHDKQKTQFAITLPSYHAVLGASKATSTYGSYLSPWKYNSSMNCRDCHGPKTAGGTTAETYILKRPYTAKSNSNTTNLLCYLCHDSQTYGKGGSSSGKTGFSNYGTNYHNIGDHKVNSVSQCTWCHTATPHGSNQAHLITIYNANDPNSSESLLTKFSHASGSYSKSSCGSNSSACDEHRGY